MRVLIAGVGNVLRGDDGFGIVAVRHIQQQLAGTAEVSFFESGIAGIALVQELLDGYDALILLDALDQGAEPGTLFVLEPDPVALAGPADPIDLHQAGPEGVFRLAAALGVLPRHVWVIGCQAADCDELGAGLSASVRRAVPAAAQRVQDLVTALCGGATKAS